MEVEGKSYQVGKIAHTPLGELRSNDVLLVLSNDRVLVGGIDCFFERHGEVAAKMFLFRLSPSSIAPYTEWITTHPQITGVHLRDVVDKLVWARLNSAKIRVILPPAIKLP